ncbi:hypothetical protein Dda_2973 [Drechslerella dactyloides]|uniref:Nucleolar 27S pre-rRNA processing Urb2/Npa2 C-terminal domain-containing protein n=1 Tax=Drechslerella dactyloides TaxID=74499 RepID=A0AAD6J0G6_DREDA|nr:hypothetical protein Dda_2973 [Drechslerella dactyloides]
MFQNEKPTMRLQSTAALTKSLRDKKTPLLDLLPVAQAVYRNQAPIFFPGKEQWLVEWLVERLDEPASSPDGRLSPEAWDILYELLTTPNLNTTAAAATLKKHKFVGILARTLSDAAARYKSADGRQVDGSASTDVEMHNAAATSPTSSSATEPGSPLVRIAFCRQGGSSRLERKNQVRQGQQIHTLFVSVFRVVEFLRTRFEKSAGGAVETSKRRRLDLTTPVLKHSPETAASLLEAYLGLLDTMIQGLGYVDEAAGWTHSCLLIWKSCSHGISDATGLVTLVSEKLMRPIAKLLCFRPVPSDIRDLAAWFFGTHLFQPISGAKEKQHDFLLAFKPLADACSGRETSRIDSNSALHSLSTILELAIEKADRDYSVKQRRQADGFVSVLLSWMLSLTDTQTSIQGQLLDIAIRQKIAVEDAALRTLTNSALRIPYAIDWKLLQAIVKIDLDILLSAADSTIFSNLSECDIRTCDEDVWAFVEQIVTASVEARDLEAFIGRWLKLLASTEGVPCSLWRSDRLQSLMSSYTETGLTQNQIVNILTTCASAAAGRSASVVIDSILRGVSRVDTIDKLSSGGVDTSLFNHLTKEYVGSDSQTRWQCLRPLLRVLEIWPVLDCSSETLKDGVMNRTKTLIAKASNLSEDAAKELSLLLTMAFVLRERSSLSIGELEVIFRDYIKLLPETGKPSGPNSWDGSFDSMSTCSNCVTAQLDRTLLQEFVTRFLEAVSQADVLKGSVNARSAWATLVKTDSAVYDNILIKVDALFNGVIATLRSQPATRGQISVVVEMLNQCPLSALRKSQREAFLDILFQFAKDATSSPEIVDVFGALNRLARLSTNSSTLATSSGLRGGLYSLFAKATDCNLETETELVTSVVRHLAESRHDEKATHQLVAATDLAIELLEKLNTSDIGPRVWAYCLVKSTFDIQVDDVAKSKLSLLTSKISTVLVGDLIASISQWDKTGGFSQTSIDMMLLESFVSKNADQTSASGIRDKIEPLLVGLDQALAEVSDEALTPRTRQSLSYYARLVCATSADDGKQATDIVLNLCEKATMLSDPQMETRINILFSQLVLAIPTCDHFEASCTILNIINMLLKDKLIGKPQGLSMSQLNVEELFASIVVTASRFGPRFDNPEANTDAIFIPLCSILANVLSSQRFRIKGRHGLFVTALAGLINILFLPRVGGRRKTDAGIHPPWLSVLKNWTVTKEAALAYSRLLTMLCNPSTSSVRMNRKADNLSSATVAAKKAVEPHIPSLLNKYINLSLTHHLPSDVRAALTPGLYAMFDVMQASTLRTLNMSLDNPGRVIFKSLYEDWNKFGKWVD